ncbi:type I polyketide synthase [Ruixingdingia sedimenti]|uniref:SDR family NAD(P)-dependent oxidoreductase n=1 Tax=Ruixingdingia sedimenti TaxID=3073604 RepID=A0ABU1F7J1_9RHOB|nr:SDR family NAD(P)-dependent oxidoreductase [Xinfangfangia sp. LG-4]MDR5652846.1 SDR family NAD(P)-dependent oxidoreductase [Xinfangfangia sp. LG-4]
MTQAVPLPPVSDTDIAIVGMAAHLPGAGSVAAYWDNLCNGIESIRRLGDDDLRAAGESAARMRQPNYVPAAATLDGFERFDAEFFGFSPKEAAIMDPQHRQFLEVAWEALEDAGHPPEGFPGQIGVFAGCGMGSYFYFNICSNPDLVRSTGMFLLRHTGNDKDFLSTRVSHILDLRGPSLNIQTACSTSLVAVHVAAQSLLNGECDMALAGGVTIELPHARGYLYEDGEILSPDGHCHAFDHRAQGTVFGSGAGCVVLRRLKDAIADGDHIWAVVKGTAVNNDGAAKAGYLAPSVDGQARCVAEAHGVAAVPADTIGYVECHGTGTYLGDPIEVAALTQAFRESTDKAGFCRIGSVKTNIGHLDTAAGVASLIKASLAVHHGEMPASLGYESPNPAIDFDTSPFRVNDRLSPFPRLDAPRRAGVNSLGVGGTNAHAVLEEPPARPPSGESDWPFQLLVLSARNKAALDEASKNLAAHLRAHPEQPLADVAWTLKQGRRAFERRRVLVAASHEEAAALLDDGDPRRVFTHTHLGDGPEVVFMFPGGGAQYAGMARDLYETEPVFREWMDRGLDHLAPRLPHDLRALWLPGEGAAGAAAALLRPSVQLPLIMIAEYALAQLWISWGVKPAALIGHSMGENTAACLAGVMGFEDCIDLVHLRGQLFDTVPPGGMLSVPLAVDSLRPMLGEGLDVASVNALDLTVISGPRAALDALETRLRADGVEPQRVQIDIAAHSRMLEPILQRFGDHLRGMRLSAPRLPVISNRTGQPLTAAEATDPAYWVAHLRGTVQFAQGMAHLMAEPGRVYLEVGPGKALSSLAQANGVPGNQVLSSLRHPDQALADDVYFLGLLGRLWALGVPVDWAPIWGEARRNRVPLPTYPFQRQSYFIEPGKGAVDDAPDGPMRSDDVAAWGWRPVWRPRAVDCPVEIDAAGLAEAGPLCWLVFTDTAGVAARAVARLRAAGHTVVEVRAGDGFARLSDHAYTLAPERGREDYDRLIRDLVARGLAPQRVAHFWLLTADESFRPGSSFFHRVQEQGFYSLLFLAQAIEGESLPRPIHLTMVTNGAAQVRDEPLPYPEKATATGPLRVIPRELPGVTCAVLDVALDRRPRGDALDRLADRVLEDMLAEPATLSAALRGERRYELTHRPVALPAADAPVLKQGAVCLITGGFGGIGLSIAESLIARHGARIVLLARRPLPPRDAWPALLRNSPPGDPLARRIAALQRLESLGGAVEVIAADVCNVEDLRAARAAAEARFGKVDVLIHAAGVVDDGPLLAKGPASVEEVFAPKVHGTQVLAGVFPDGDLDLMVVFSSTSTVIAPAGQVDYVAANEFLNAWAKSRQGGRTRVLALDWGIWTGVGMAAEALAERAPAPRTPAGQPLLDVATFDAEGHRLYTADWRVADRWVLDGHRLKSGAALIPGTGYLELAAEALRAQGETGPFEIRDLYFFRPLAVDEGETRALRLRLARRDEGYGFELRSDVQADGRRGFQLNAQAVLALGHIPAPAPLDLPAIAARCTEGVAEDPQGIRSPQEDHLTFGPRWRVLRRMGFGQGEGLARLVLADAFRAELAGYTLHPALMDIATGWAMRLIAGYHPTHLWVPVSYARVTVHRPLPAEIHSWVRNATDNTAEGPFASFDVTLADAAGQVCVEVHGFTIRRLDGALTLTQRVDARELEFPETGAARPPSPAEERLRHNLTQGILPGEGADAFHRALALGLPQVIVSSMPLDALERQAGEGAGAEAAAGQKFQRPELDSAYAAPRNDIERTLVGFWEDLLGVDRVGVEDSFFDLGGHSLIAVRLFAMIRKAWSVDFPISVLFEAPTIARCAALIEQRIGPVAEGTGDAPRAPERRFTHLVPMHEGEGGPRTPFFLVAGMFGNVLNLRHLAQLLGHDRPFYGLQARGLYGDQEPHGTLEEAARDCIAELRQVQPRGPYLVGGFSGGGLTAWEIARQLEAAGETVALTVLLDTPLPMRPGLSRADRLLIRLAEAREKGPAFAAEWLRAKRAYRAELRRRAEQGAAESEGHQFHNAAIEAAFRAALPLYGLQPRSAPVVLFRPPLDRRWQVTGGRWVSTAREYVTPDNDWSPFAPALSVIEVPGDHDSMVLEPNVRVLAARLRAAIEAAERPAPLARAAE